MLINRLQELGVKFGDLPVISNLSDTVLATKEDLLARIAQISIVHEGKGIKSIGRLMKTMRKCNDSKSEEILKVIESEETFHF